MKVSDSLRKLAQNQVESGGPVGPVALPVTPVGRWLFDGDFTGENGPDMSSYGNTDWSTGPLPDTQSLAVSVWYSGATLGNDTMVATAGTTKSISAWVYVTSFYSQWQNIFGYNGGGIGWTVVSISPSGNIDWRWDDSPTSTHVMVSPDAIALNGWVHITCTIDLGASTGCIYVNGSKVAERTDATGSASTSGHTISSGFNGVNYGQLYGRLHDVCFYDVALTEAQASQLYYTYDTVGASTNDADVDEFIWEVEKGAVILTQTEIDALDTLVSTLKTNGTWSKYKALYPMVGASEDGHKFNLRDPRDADGAYRLDFRGTWTHTVDGAKGDGSTAYAQTFFRDDDITTLVDSSTVTIGIGYYSNDATATAGNYKCEMGGDGNGGALLDILMQFNDGGGEWRQFYGPDGRISVVSAHGSMVAYNGTGAQIQEFKDGVPHSGTSLTEKGPTNAYICLNGLGQTDPAIQGTTQDFNSDARCGLAYISDGLTDAEVTTDFAAFDAFNTALNR